ncbi:transmembrane protein TA-2-like [Scophthalmus maximus]|uniref:Threonylcarbamoyl-AMP synthase n=1 Tax=Scophthalmus maximus TaxID=52904 RepID=A0A2U9C9E4_SCOMX|nr:transmembrane protein TA-2-like [Scophthalmus maximus]
MTGQVLGFPYVSGKRVELHLDNQDTMSTSDGFPASFYGEPGVLGMLSNGISAFLVLLQNFNTAHTGSAPVGVENILAAFCSATVNYIMPFVFGAITFTLVFEAVGLVASSWALVVSGVLELLILIFAIYGSAALLIKGLTQRLVLKGFGTPLFNVLLLGTANSASAQSIGQEKKKNTKYAEPMALGFFCDTVAPFIFAFYSFGYVKSFGLGAAWVSIISVAQLFSSYYAHLRQDCYHTTKFGLHATYWLIKAWDEFVASVLTTEEGQIMSGREAMVGNWFFVVAGLVLCVGSLNMDVLELIHNMLFVLLTVSTIPQIPLQAYYIFFGVACSLFTAISLYGTFARLINTIAEKSLIPVGPQPISTERLRQAFKHRSHRQGRQEASDALFYMSNGVAALSALHASVSSYLLQLSTEASYGFTAGAIAFLVINTFLMLIVAMLALVSIICVYGALASLMNCIFSQSMLPMGPPLLKEKVKQETSPELPCPVANSQLTSGLLKIAGLLEEGGVCGIPTDTVYALAASCKNPQAIEKIYNIKDRPAEKPICICISSVEQLVAVKPPFSPLLWEFMRNVYPGGISCIVTKGDWLYRLGVGPAYDRVGTQDSIMIRVPDHTPTCHLCDITGPLAITSANPSGEADSTHHSMVIDRLGHKIQGVLCDGVSNEVVASTVVNCLNIDEGTITILREGCVPAVKVRQIFERVKSMMV